MTWENVTVQNIFDLGNRPYGGGTRAGGTWEGPIPEQSKGRGSKMSKNQSTLRGHRYIYHVDS